MSDGSRKNSETESEASSDGPSRSLSRHSSHRRMITNVGEFEQDVSENDISEARLKHEKRSWKRRTHRSAVEELAKLRDGRRPQRDRYLSARYRNTLNLMTDDVNEPPVSDDSGELLASQIGASHWSADEKEKFFTALVSKGPDDLGGIAQIIRTKNAAEIAQYLTLLRDASDHVSPRTEASRTPAEVPAAVEISSDCETLLDFAADALAMSVDKEEVAAERDKFGQNWLIDEHTADRMEAQYDEVQPSHDSGEDEAPFGAQASRANVSESARSARDLTEPQSIDAAPAGTGASHGAAPERPGSNLPDTLLRPSSLLELSRILFMNSETDDELNWQRMNPVSSVADSPAIFQSALAQLSDIALSLTRRLVQVAIFQANSRLRAVDSMRANYTPAAVVREVDVRTAVAVIGLELNPQKYWATVARRCKVGVLSRHSKYNDGRPGTRTGFRLTYDEVEDALGQEDHINPGFATDYHVEDIHDVDVWDAIDDEDRDLLTDQESTDSEATSGTGDGSRGRKDVNESVQFDTPRSATRPRKRKFDANSDHRHETRLLEFVDHEAKLYEEAHMWQVLRLDPPPQRPSGQKTYEVLSKPLRHIDCSVDQVDHRWRQRMPYLAPWEHAEPPPSADAFREMGDIGARARKRRAVLYDRITDRLEADERRTEEGTSDNSIDGGLDSGSTSGEDEPEKNGSSANLSPSSSASTGSVKGRVDSD